MAAEAAPQQRTEFTPGEDEAPGAPLALLTQFMAATESGDFAAALGLARRILEAEPDNALMRKYVDVLGEAAELEEQRRAEEKLAEDAEAGGTDDEEESADDEESDDEDDEDDADEEDDDEADAKGGADDDDDDGKLDEKLRDFKLGEEPEVDAKLGGDAEAGAKDEVSPSKGDSELGFIDLNDVLSGNGDGEQFERIRGAMLTLQVRRSPDC
mmetsp:Transcript_22922/g.71235  ORF Transcript_22922/g.71235 Transcript_22922/m.71235 type:complete len:213 (-) Transcript_22922:587-1225(-)